jgi:hypothetical protein
LSADVFDDLDQFVEAVAVVAGEVDEFFRRWTTPPRNEVDRPLAMSAPAI